ncbi:MAG: hypothetical protein QME81_01105 [bacterium]|nr:hypothetical protein [bacterium]
MSTGIYDESQIKLLEKVDISPNIEVIITFLDDRLPQKPVTDKTKELLALSGTWNDDRSVDEMIKEIYESRTIPEGKGENIYARNY